MASLKGLEIDYVPLPDGLRVQILGSMQDLPKGQLHHFAAFLDDLQILVVWDDEPEKLVHRAQNLEQRFMEIIWGNQKAEEAESPDEKKEETEVVAEEIDPAQLEEALSREYRPIRLENAFMVAATLALAFTCLGLGWRNLAIEVMVDSSYTRLALAAVGPVQLFASLVSYFTHSRRRGVLSLTKYSSFSMLSSAIWRRSSAQSLR